MAGIGDLRDMTFGDVANQGKGLLDRAKLAMGRAGAAVSNRFLGARTPDVTPGAVPDAAPEPTPGAAPEVARQPYDPASPSAAERANAKIAARQAAAAQPAVAPGAAAPQPAATGTGVQPYDPVQGQRFAPGGQPPQGGSVVPRDPAMPPQGNVYEGQGARVPPEMIKTAQNPNIHNGASAEGTAFEMDRNGTSARLEKAAADKAAAAAETGGEAARGARGLFGKLGRFGTKLGIAGGVVSGLDAYGRASAGNTVEQKFSDGSSPALDGLRGAVAQFGDNMLLGQGRAAGTALGYGVGSLSRPGAFDKGVFPAISTAASDAAEGWRTAKDLERRVDGNNGASLPDISKADPSSPTTTSGARSAAAKPGGDATGLIPGQDATQPAQQIQGRRAQDIIDHPYDMPTEGTGAVQITHSDGTKGPAQFIDTRGARGADARPAYASVSGEGAVHADGSRGPGTVGGYARAMTNLGVAMHNERSERADKELGIKAANYGLSRAKFAQELGNDTRKQVGEQVRAAASSDPELAKITDPKERETETNRRVADAQARLNYSLGRRNIDTSVSTPKLVNDFLDAEKWRKAVEQGRGTIGQQLRDFAGNKRHDSKDSFSYRPAFYEDGPTGRKIYTENGNSVDLRGATTGNPWGNLFSPNNPEDADMLRYVQGLPSRTEYEASLKKSQKGAR